MTTTATVHRALRDHAFRGPECFPSQALLAQETGLRRETVNRACKQLEREGCIAIRKRRVPGSRWEHNVYVLRTRWAPPSRHKTLRRLDEIRGSGRLVYRPDHTKRTETATTAPKEATLASEESSEGSSRALACKACGVVGEIAGIENLTDTIKALEATLVGNRAHINKLKGELVDKRGTNKLRPAAEEVFAHWRTLCSPRAREFTGARFDSVVARLRAGASVDLLKLAVEGAAYKPYVLHGGRRSATGEPSQREVRLDLICRSEDHVDRFASYVPPRTELEDIQAQLDIVSLALFLRSETFMPTPERLDRQAFLATHAAQFLRANPRLAA